MYNFKPFSSAEFAPTCALVVGFISDTKFPEFSVHWGGFACWGREGGEECPCPLRQSHF